jgi:hypothetical protein
MQHLEGSGTPILYIGRTVLNFKFVTRLTFMENLRLPIVRAAHLF